MLSAVQYYSLLVSLIMVFCLACYWAVQQKRIPSKSSTECRNALRAKVKQYRLRKMLQFIGVDFDTYINRLPDEEIQLHIVRCSQCPNLPQCDDCLRDGHMAADMNFCPNFKRLNQLSQELSPSKPHKFFPFFII